MVKDGYWYGLPLLVAAALLFALHLFVLAVLFLLISIFALNFFRDPERRVPADPRAIVSPADGKVVQIIEEELEGKTVKRLSIFMSPLNVHVNRSPIPGVIKKVIYRPGSFHIASKSAASVENEQNAFTVEGELGRVVVKQIAGAVARRIVFWKRLGDRLARGERVGMIKFGSRVDLIIETGAEWNVKVGDRVQAGSSILGFATPQSE
ncbi:MAG TPA: phosphatidylserine decarboxylase family protein [Terriglobia bacterium]|nr:phosphatidylserine decarboxylase family protein [Terriglobia bacterium]